MSRTYRGWVFSFVCVCVYLFLIHISLGQFISTDMFHIDCLLCTLLGARTRNMNYHTNGRHVKRFAEHLLCTRCQAFGTLYYNKP